MGKKVYEREVVTRDKEEGKKIVESQTREITQFYCRGSRRKGELGDLLKGF